MLRAGVLDGRNIALRDASAVLEARLSGLGATTVSVVTPTGEAGHTTLAPPDVLVVDSARAFARADGGYDGLRAAVDGAFACARDIATAAWIEHDRAGRIVLLAPPPGAGAHAEATAAGLENLVRTLGTEWARQAVTTVAVRPGDTTTPEALADLVAWLATPAGAYLSGTALTLDRPLQPVGSS